MNIWDGVKWAHCCASCHGLLGGCHNRHPYWGERQPRCAFCAVATQSERAGSLNLGESHYEVPVTLGSFGNSKGKRFQAIKEAA